MVNHRSHSFSDGSNNVAYRLSVHRDCMNPRAFVLSWRFPEGTSVGTEGECSRRYFKTEAAAKAYALRTYDERAVRMPTFGITQWEAANRERTDAP
jgi:hypothetical protein